MTVCIAVSAPCGDQLQPPSTLAAPRPAAPLARTLVGDSCDATPHPAFDWPGADQHGSPSCRGAGALPAMSPRPAPCSAGPTIRAPPPPLSPVCPHIASQGSTGGPSERKQVWQRSAREGCQREPRQNARPADGRPARGLHLWQMRASGRSAVRTTWACLSASRTAAASRLTCPT